MSAEPPPSNEMSFPFRAIFILSACALLSACGGGHLLSSGEMAEVRHRQDGGNHELIIEPVDFWDKENAAPPEAITVGGREISVRLRKIGPFERAWVRAGLFWHSKMKDNVYLPVVVANQKVKIERVQIYIDGQQAALLARAKNFQFTPAKRSFDKELVSGAFVLPIGVLEQMTTAERAEILVQTNRGDLKVDLSIVTGKTPTQLQKSGKHLFAEFVDQMGDIRG